MSFWKNVFLGLGALGAFLLRPIIGANYTYVMQRATDAYIRATIALGGIVALTGLNALFMWYEQDVMQAFLLLLSMGASAFFVFSPAIAVPVVGVIVGAGAAQPGDQVNIDLLTRALKRFANAVGLVYFWFSLYILTTIVVPFGLSMKVFMMLHVVIILSLTLLMSGKVKTTDIVYEIAWYGAIAAVAVSVLAMFVFAEDVDPWLAERAAKKSERLLANQRTMVVRQADEFLAKWLRDNVVVENGNRVVIVKGKAESAEPHIAKARALRDQQVALISGPASGTNVTAALGLGDGGIPKWMLFGALLLAAFGAVWYFSHRNVVTISATTKTSSASKSSSGGLGTLLVLAALVLGGFWAYNNATVRGWFEQDAAKVHSNIRMMPSITSLTSQDFLAVYVEKSPTVHLPQSLWSGKSVKIGADSYVTPEGMHVRLSFGHDNGWLDLLLTDAKCALVSNRVPYVCEGKWKTGKGLQGAFRLEWDQQGSRATVKLYKEDNPAQAIYPIAEITFDNTTKKI